MSTSGDNNNNSNTKKVVILKSKDGDEFEVEEAAAAKSITVKNMMEDVGTEDPIALPNVESGVLAKVIEYCKKHAQDPSPAEEELKGFDAELVKIGQNSLFDLIMAANYLNIPGLLDLGCQTVANMIKNKTPEEIRKTFGIVNDFTPEEEAQVRRENQWAFE